MLLEPEEARYGICGECRPSLSPASGEFCGRCGRPLISERGLCLSCREAAEGKEAPGGPGGPDRTLVLYPYTGVYRKILSAYKFEKSLGTGRFLAERLEAGFRDLNIEAVLVPVPPRPGKIKKQGWDQIEYLARLLEKKLPLKRCLKRLPSRSQKELNREKRRTNLAGRIAAAGEVPKIAVVFDDVMTTGSTLAACTEALRNAGTERVYGLCLFYD
jgi:ComF family protein